MVGTVQGGVAAVFLGSTGEAIALVWSAHIGINRALGFGLKYDEGFAFTHLGRTGRQLAGPERTPLGGARKGAAK